MFSKRLFYLSENSLAAWHWRSGQLAQAGTFGADADGLASFSDYLAASPGAPIYLLLDVIEEDFHNETAPHLAGKDRQALIGRKLNHAFRTTAYRHASSQGREADGRRDDKLLLTGVTNEALIKPWVERILKHQQALAGIWSLPLLSQVLTKKLGLDVPHQLLITRQESTGLRQSYFQQGQIKFSRLTLISPEDIAAMADTVSRETSRTQQYLNSLRLLPRDAALEVAVCGERHLLQLQAETMNTPLLRYQVFSLEDTIGKLGFKHPAGNLTSEMLYLNLLGRFAPPQHYATPEQMWYSRLRQVRTGILGATTLVLALAGYSAWQNLDQALDDYNQSEKIARETQSYFGQYQAIKRAFPPTPTTPENMKGAVDLMQRVHDQDVMPQALMALVSQALETSKSVRLHQIKWQVSDTPNEESAPAPKNTPPSARANIPGIVIDAAKPYQIAILDGEISPFSDYRSALNDVNRFIEILKKNPSLQAAALAMPIDIGSSASLQGSAGKKAQEKAAFSVKLVLRSAP